MFALCFTLLSVFLLYILYGYLIYIFKLQRFWKQVYIYIYCNLKMYIKYLHLFFPYQKGNWQCMYLSHPRKQYLFCYFDSSYYSFLLKHCPFNLFLETPFLMEKEKVCIFNINFQIAMFLKTGVQYRSKISEPLNAFPTQSQRVGVLNLTRLRLRVHANANAFSEAH